MLAKQGVRHRCYVHRLVLIAFCGEPAPGMEVCHNNDIRTDNRLENLRWDTHLANVGDTIGRGRHRNPLAERRAAMTHCDRGHEFDEANRDHLGRRSCRECKRLKERERYHHNKSLGITKQYDDSQRTHCRRGHELTPANTYARSNGKKDCIQCKQQTYTAWLAKRKAG